MRPSRQDWLIRAVVLIMAVAMIATEPAVEYAHQYHTMTPGPAVDLSPASTKASFLVRARAVALGRGGSRTTDGASVTLNGTVALKGAVTQVLVNVSDARNVDPRNALDVSTAFGMAHGLSFSGDCKRFDPASPCEAVLQIDFERVDGGASGSTVSIGWSLEFDAQVPTEDGPGEKGIPLPWSIEVTPL